MAGNIVLCNLPKAGLGNQLFPLMHARLFSELNGLPLIVLGYNQLSIGPYVRREKKKRRYGNYFKFQKDVLSEYLDWLKVRRLKRKYNLVHEPPVEKVQSKELGNTMFIFEQIPDSQDYFKRLKGYRTEVSALLYSMINPWLLDCLERQEPHVIGIHARMGDFSKLAKGEIYKSGHVRVPEEYFIKTVKLLREISACCLPVAVFTDGFREEFREIFYLKGIEMVEQNPDIVDLLLLSRSKIIIPTHGSTFSMWAAFLSDAIIIFNFPYPNLIRPDSLRETLYEGVLDTANEQLRMAISAIKISVDP
jgi:hypothetical protein